MATQVKEIECISCKSAFWSNGEGLCPDCIGVMLDKDDGDFINVCDVCGAYLGDYVFCACDIP